MEGLAPPLKCLIEMQSSLQNGETVRSGVIRYLNQHPPSEEFAIELRRFLFAWDQGHDWRKLIASNRSPHRRALMDLLATSMSGQPILSHLEDLRSEIIAACDHEIRHHLELLPLKMLAPLLLFQFPAFLLLLFGPLLSRLLAEMRQ